MTNDRPCPCGHPLPYAACCEPLHRGIRRARTAEELMRSRYAAFSQGEVDYLIATWHPSQRGALQRHELAQSTQAIRWVGLTIREVLDGQPDDASGIVAFEARYQERGRTGVMRERSRFLREGGVWFYLDGDVT